MSSPFLAPAAALASLSRLCDFVLEVSLGFLLCTLLSRLSTTPKRRFLVWMTFSITATLYWLWTLCQVLGLLPSSIAGDVQAVSSASQTGFLFSLPHPLHWTFPSELATWIGRAILSALVAYGAVLAFLAGVGLHKRWRLLKALRFRTTAPAPIAALFSRVARDMGVGNCSLWVLAGLPTPATVGWPRASVYLPVECLEDDEASMLNILRHELAHVSRQDSLWELIARVAKTLVFFHPAVNRAFLSLRLERELACDLTVIQSQPDHRDDYANTLVRFGWKAAAHKPDAMGIGLAAGSAILHARVQSILAGEPVYSAGSRRLRSLFSAGTFGLFILAAPLLWVGFRLTAANVTLSIEPASPAPVASVRHSRRTSLNRLPHFAVNEPIASPVAANAQENQLPQLGSAPLPSVHYQSDHAQSAASVGLGGSGTSSQGSQPTIPDGSSKVAAVNSQSAMSAAVSAAIALSHLGGGDHDHDHN